MKCAKCVFDSNDCEEFVLDTNGICNFCRQYEKEESEFNIIYPEKEKEFNRIIQLLKHEGRGKKYDTILGVSGGVDSSYLALKLKENGVRTLLYHYDNGWDSELAVKNIQRMAQKLDFDLYTIVVDWDEFKDLQLSYLKAGVIDIEAITDHSAIFGTLQVAKKFNIRNIVGGHNFVTESILPKSWIYPAKGDWYNLKSIHSLYGTKKISSVPVNSLLNQLIFTLFYKMKWYYPLNFIPYNKDLVKKELLDKLEWKDYGGKHYESIWTRFYQGYFLPTRYGIDKRKAHLSNLINSRQLSREEALAQLSLEIYPPKLLKQDKEFIIKKFGITEAVLLEFINLPKRSHYEFDHMKPLGERYFILKPLIMLKKVFFK
jgi:N-acetyl sugar amidotransferase